MLRLAAALCVVALLPACDTSETSAESVARPGLEPAPAPLNCAGTWVVEAPTRGDSTCPVAGPHALSFSVDEGTPSTARRHSGERLPLQLGEHAGGCTAEVELTDRFSADAGAATLTMREVEGALEGELSRPCLGEPIAVSGRRTPTVLASRETTSEPPESPRESGADVTPTKLARGTFLDLGVPAPARLAKLDGWIASYDGADTLVRGSELVPLVGTEPRTSIVVTSPCTAMFGDEPRAFVAGDAVFWAGGGHLTHAEIIACDGGGRHVFRIRPGEPARGFEYRTSLFKEAGWYETQASCRVELGERLTVLCEADRDYRFESVGDVLLHVAGRNDPPLESRGFQLDARSGCERTLARYAAAFEPSAKYFTLPRGRSATLAYTLSAPARAWVAECEQAPQAARQCLANAGAPLPAINPCDGAPDMPTVGFSLELKRVGPEEPVPSRREARLILDRLVGQWGDPERLYLYDARFFRQRGTMKMYSGGDLFDVTVTGRRTIDVVHPRLQSYRRFAFTDDGRLHLNSDAIDPLTSRDRYRANVGVFSFIEQYGACVMLGPRGFAHPARCTFEVGQDGAEVLVLAADDTTDGEFTEFSRIPIIDGMLVHPALRPFENGS